MLGLIQYFRQCVQSWANIKLNYIVLIGVDSTTLYLQQLA